MSLMVGSAGMETAELERLSEVVSDHIHQALLGSGGDMRVWVSPELLSPEGKPFSVRIDIRGGVEPRSEQMENARRDMRMDICHNRGNSWKLVLCRLFRHQWRSWAPLPDERCIRCLSWGKPVPPEDGG